MPITHSHKLSSIPQVCLVTLTIANHPFSLSVLRSYPRQRNINQVSRGHIQDETSTKYPAATSTEMVDCCTEHTSTSRSVLIRIIESAKAITAPWTYSSYFYHHLLPSHSDWRARPRLSFYNRGNHAVFDHTVRFLLYRHSSYFLKLSWFSRLSLWGGMSSPPIAILHSYHPYHGIVALRWSINHIRSSRKKKGS